MMTMTAAGADYLPRVEQMYMAFYGRSADTDGAAFWAAKLASMGGDATMMTSAFAHSAEATRLYGGLSDQTMINTIYQQVFGRDADTSGLDFYMGQLHTGAMSPDRIMLNILDGARDLDLARLQAHVDDAIALMDPAQMNALMTQYGASMPGYGGAGGSGMTSMMTQADLSGISPWDSAGVDLVGMTLHPISAM